ncbi:unnamed protein product [Calypogeia fissa]
MTLDVVMADGDDSCLLIPADQTLRSNGGSGSVANVVGDLSGGGADTPAFSPPSVCGPGSSPTKYVSPRLRGSLSPTSPTTLLPKRVLVADAAPNWRSNLLFGVTSNTAAPVPTISSQNPSFAREVLGTTKLSRDTPVFPDEISAHPNVISSNDLVGPLAMPPPQLDVHTTLENDTPGTPAFRRLFRTACLSSNTRGLFNGARIKHGRFSAASLFTSLQDHSERGVILSFSQRAPSYDHFRIWIDSLMSQAGILIDDASQLGNDFFLLLLHDQANQRLVLKQKLFFLNKYVDIFPWTPAFAPHELSNKTRPIWVELTNLHPSLRLRSTVEGLIQDYIGPVLYFPETKTLVHHSNPRVLVRWTMSEDLIDFLSLEDNGNTLLQQVTFLNHPDCCHRCKRQGHQMKDCNNESHFRRDSQSRLTLQQTLTDTEEAAIVKSRPHR